MIMSSPVRHEATLGVDQTEYQHTQTIADNIKIIIIYDTISKYDYTSTHSQKVNARTDPFRINNIHLIIEKKIYFSEITRPTALIFGMWQWLMVLYINCASHAPGVKFGHTLGVNSLHNLMLYLFNEDS